MLYVCLAPHVFVYSGRVRLALYIVCTHLVSPSLPCSLSYPHTLKSLSMDTTGCEHQGSALVLSVFVCGFLSVCLFVLIC